MTKKQTNKQEEEINEKTIEEWDDFSFEVSLTSGDMEIIKEIQNEEFDELVDYAEEIPPPKKTVKIISEKNIEIKEHPPPNYSPNFICVLHFKNKDYKIRKKIPIEIIEEK